MSNNKVELFAAFLQITSDNAKPPEQAKPESTELFMAPVDKVIVGDALTFIMRDETARAVDRVR